MVSKDHKLSVRRQCVLLTLVRSNLYYVPKGESAENLRFMEIIDKQFLETPWYGSRQMAPHMERQGHKCGQHRVRRLMRLMRLVPIYQEPNTSNKHPQHKIWPYLLRKMVIDRPNQVWCADITYIPMQRGFLYLVAIMDWYSRKVLAWLLSHSMDAEFCVKALKEALTTSSIKGETDVRSKPVRDRSKQYSTRPSTSAIASCGFAGESSRHAPSGRAQPVSIPAAALSMR